MADEAIAMITGLFETHISVNPDEIFALRMFCLDKKIKPVLACSEYGDNSRQLMISVWSTGDGRKAIEEAQKLASEMATYGMNVERAKVEAMAHNKNVPQEENELFNEEQYYFEFHTKIPVSSSKEYKKLNDLVMEKLNGAVSFSAFKPKVELLLTLRYPAKNGFKHAEEKYKEMIDELIKLGYANAKEFPTQKEMSIYDTNTAYDKNWL